MRSALSRLSGQGLAITGSRVCNEVTGECVFGGGITCRTGAVGGGSRPVSMSVAAVDVGGDGCFTLSSFLGFRGTAYAEIK